jgi:hypothetical protein
VYVCVCVCFCLVGVCAFVYLSVLYSEQYSLPELLWHCRMMTLLHLMMDGVSKRQ